MEGREPSYTHIAHAGRYMRSSGSSRSQSPTCGGFWGTRSADGAGLRAAGGYQASGLPEYKPVSVPLRVAVIHLGRTLLCGSSDLPGSRAGRAAPPPLFGLAPRGVCPAGRIAPAAVRSYRTISPLPRLAARRYLFCGTFRIRFLGPRPLAGTLPYGDRTFLPRAQRAPRERLPVRQPHMIIVALYRRRLAE